METLTSNLLIRWKNCASIALETRFLWLSSTPFERPVVPEV